MKRAVTEDGIRHHLVCLEGVRNAIVEQPIDRRIVSDGCIRITILGGYADIIGAQLSSILPVHVQTEGFSEVVVDGTIFRFDHVEPCIRVRKKKTIWRRFWDWLNEPTKGVSEVKLPPQGYGDGWYR